ncbi:unnamed protein product [Urochloa humidicola]
MERMGKMKEITVARPDMAPAGGSAAICEANNKQAGKEPTTPGTPSSAATGMWRGNDGRRAEGGALGALPGWKLDCLCNDPGLPAAAKGGFLCF